MKRLERRCFVKVFFYMEKIEVSKETLFKIKNLPRIPFNTFKELISNGLVEPFCKLKVARTIFYDEDDGFFYYVNPYHRALCKCGKFREEDQNG